MVVCQTFLSECPVDLDTWIVAIFCLLNNTLAQFYSLKRVRERGLLARLRRKASQRANDSQT